MLKATPSHFCVTELPDPAVPMPEGKHLHVILTREGSNTRDVQTRLSVAFGVPRVDDVGFAGLKDRWARTTQAFSIPWECMSKELRAASGLTAPSEGCLVKMRAKLDEVATAESWVIEGPPHWSNKKLKRGELRGNHFSIVITETVVPPAEAVDRAQQIAEKLRQRGWANYYGPQRLGKGGISAARGRALLLQASGNGDGSRKRKRQPWWLEQLEANAFQSALFNLCVATRVTRGLFERILVGDLVCSPSGGQSRIVMPAEQEEGGGAGGTEDGAEGGSHSSAKEGGAPSSSGGVVSAEDAHLFGAGVITHTGPMWGSDMARVGGTQADIEEEVWRDYADRIHVSGLRKLWLLGSRRPARLPLPIDFSARAHADGVEFSFSLPAGAYATSLLREFMRNDAEAEVELELEETMA